jgi:translation initiation factor 3 subunit A
LFKTDNSHTYSSPFSLLSALPLQNALQERIIQERAAEFGRLKKERDERMNRLISSRKHERETVRKLMFYLNLEEQRIEMLREEEEARKREGK